MTPDETSINVAIAGVDGWIYSPIKAWSWDVQVDDPECWVSPDGERYETKDLPNYCASRDLAIDAARRLCVTAVQQESFFRCCEDEKESSSGGNVAVHFFQLLTLPAPTLCRALVAALQLKIDL